jgi:hypothetical protein
MRRVCLWTPPAGLERTAAAQWLRMGETIRFEKVGRIMVIVHSEHEPSHAEWEDYLGHLRAEPRCASVFVYSIGGGPNAKQRQSLADATAGRALPVAVVTPSRMTRAIGVAVSWFNPHIQMFSPGYLPDAFAHLRLGMREAAEVIHSARHLASQLGIPRAESELVVEIPVRQAG